MLKAENYLFIKHTAFFFFANDWCFFRKSFWTCNSPVKVYSVFCAAYYVLNSTVINDVSIQVPSETAEGFLTKRGKVGDISCIRVVFFLVGYGLERGGIVNRIHNNDPKKAIRVVFLDIVPWFLRVYLHTLKVSSEGKLITPGMFCIPLFLQHIWSNMQSCINLWDVVKLCGRLHSNTL